MFDLDNNINDYNPTRKNRENVFDIIADIMTNKKLQAIILEFLIRKLTILYRMH